MSQAVRHTTGRSATGPAHLTPEAESMMAPLLGSPRLPEMVESLGHALEEERRRRAEFFDALTDETKAEFINGEKVVSSPNIHAHNRIVLRLGGLLDQYVVSHDLGTVTVEKALVSFTRNDYMPDLCYWRKAGAAKIDARTMRYPVPDLIVEVLSESTARQDRGVKFEDYAAHGVSEYWIVDPDAETVEVYGIEGGRYALREKVADGPVHSRVIDGLVLPARALFDDAARRAAADALREVR